MKENETATEIVAIERTEAELKTVQKHRYAHLKPVYNNDSDALKLTFLIEGKGPNSWKKVTDKISFISNADYNQQMYHDALIDSFVIGQTYTSDDIIGIVGEVRNDLRLGTYLSGLKKNCEADFFNLFIVHTVTAEICCEDDSDKMKKVIIGYTPVFSLKPQE